MTSKLFAFTDNITFVEVSEGESVERSMDGENIVEITEDENGTFTVEAAMWYSPEGKCSLAVNHVSEEEALLMFGALLSVETR